MNILQIFNAYRFQGGEEVVFNQLGKVDLGDSVMHSLRFSTKNWVCSTQGNPLKQALLMVHNPSSVEEFRQKNEEVRPDVFVLHNLMPEGSAGVYREILRTGTPALHYIHNFRPFSVSGYLWAKGNVQPAGLRKNFWPEIFAGSWQESRIKTAWYAMILTGMHHLGYYDRIRGWIAISEFMKKVFVEAGVPEDRVHTLPHFWDAMDSVPHGEDAGQYVFLGSLIEMKGIPTLLEAWRLLEADLGGACPILCIGGQGSLEPMVREAASQSNRIRFLGHVSGETKHHLLAGARAFLAPSVWWEPLGLVTYEAYDYGKPMLAARSGGLSETVQHGTTGFLHEPGNARELAEHVKILEKDDALRHAMGMAGREWLVEHTSRERWMDKFFQICHTVLQK